MSEPSSLQPIRRTRASEAVFTALTDFIRSDEIAVGDRLPGELALAERLGVSRSVVREALQACATMGLTEARTGQGTYVIAKTATMPLSFGEFSARDLVEARPHVEVPSAGLAATRRTEAELAHLRELVAQLERTDDLRTWAQLDGALHRAIAAASHNPVFEFLIGSTRDALDRLSETLNVVTEARQQASDTEHARIVEAIAAGSAPQAEAAMAAHLGQVAEAVEQLEQERTGRTSAD